MNAPPRSRAQIRELMGMLCDEGFPLERAKRQHFLDIADADEETWKHRPIELRPPRKTAELMFACRMLLLDDCWYAIQTLRRQRRERRGRKAA